MASAIPDSPVHDTWKNARMSHPGDKKGRSSSKIKLDEKIIFFFTQKKTERHILLKMKLDELAVLQK